MVRESAADRPWRTTCPALAAAPETAERSAPCPRWGERGRLLLLRGGERLPAAEFSPATRRAVVAGGAAVVHDTRGDLKVVGVVDAPRLGGRLVGVDPPHRRLWPAADAPRGSWPSPGGCVLIVTVGMLVFASRASTQAVRALSSAVRRVEAGEVDAGVLRLDTGDEIGELSAVVERYVRQSRDLRDNLEEKVRAKTQRLEALHHIDRGILAAESVEAIARGALAAAAPDRAVPLGRRRCSSTAAPSTARFLAVHGDGRPDEGAAPAGSAPADVLRARACVPRGPGGPRRLLPDLPAAGGRRHRSLLSAPLVAGGEPIGLLCVAGSPSRAASTATTRRSWARSPRSSRWPSTRRGCARRSTGSSSGCRRWSSTCRRAWLLLERDGRIALANPLRARPPGDVATPSAAGDVTELGGLLARARCWQGRRWSRARSRGGRRRRVPGRGPAARRRAGRRSSSSARSRASARPRRSPSSRRAWPRSASSPPASRTTSTTS